METSDPLDAIPRALRDVMTDPARRDQTLVVDGVDVRVEYDPRPGVDRRIRVEEDGKGMLMTTYEAAAERPASYPADLPFLPGRQVTVTSRGDAPEEVRIATWWAVGDVEGALAELGAQAGAAGWVRAEGSTEYVIPGVRMVDFHHPDGRTRLVQTAAFGATGMISLYENP